ncbi:MAG: DegT/DnrJ/EryC1/StrS family aminotransferase, partial [Alphaproteobacteria bacterium]|nr:DegT/DnrJ/EryC1/StrS family aminotransferase [Alphaproteobacteria bacterium]
MDNFIDNTLLKLTSFLKEKEFPLHVPSFNQKEQDLVLDCVKTGWVSSEKDLEIYTGIKKCVVVMNGTAALHICYISSGVKENDEVLCPSLTFVATANAIKYCRAIPHFVEVEKDTLGVCPIKLRKYLEE